LFGTLPAFGHPDKQNAARAVGKHANVKKELAPAAVVVLV
jgi:hypothetical protein